VDDIAGLCAAADVMISPSAYEGLSLAHLEALAAGLPVVTTDVGGAAEVAHAAKERVALVARDAGPSAYAMAFSRVRELPRSPGSLPESFSVARMAERYHALLSRAATERARARRAGVLLITNNFSTGGAQSSARRLLTGLLARGVRARAAVLEEREDHPTPGLSALRAAGVPVTLAPLAGANDPAVTASAILDEIDRDCPEAVLFVNAIFEHKLLLADALYDVPIVDASPGEMYFASIARYFERPRPGLPYFSPRDYGARLRAVVVKYQGEAARAEEALCAPVIVIPNGVPLGPIAPRVPGDRLVLGTAARIAPQKKLEELVLAVRHAHPRMPPYVLRVAGAPERDCEAYRRELQQLARGLPIEWVGERDAWHVGLDAFVMISEPAGCPNASLEAMAAGLPVFATDVGGAREQIEDGVSGRITPRGDPRALGDAIADAARDPGKLAAWGAAGRARAERLFGEARMVADYARALGISC
jgi:glycosyltransferase involved in cell wall biosynthesis